VEEHLTDEQIEKILHLDLDDDASEIDVQSQRERAQRHVADCQSCRLKVEAHGAALAALRSLRATMTASPGPNCPHPDVWSGIVCGPESENSQSYLNHAASCDYCGPLLQEEADLAQLNSSTPEWQHQVALRLASTTALKKSGSATNNRSLAWMSIFTSRMNLAFASVLLIALTTFGIWLRIHHNSNDTAENLLAQAYTEHRRLDVRIPGARFTPKDTTRGNTESNLDRSLALQKAETLIAENLKLNPNDPAWLQARARADLLDGNYNSAINALGRALEMAPNSPSLRTDLATLYIARGTIADYTNAVDILSGVLQQHPDDQIALFNRALALEKLSLFDQAEDDWRRYIRLDPASGWSAEATRRLEGLETDHHNTGGFRVAPLVAPSQFALLAQANKYAAWESVDARIEEYQRVAVRDWLSQAFPVRTADPNDEFQVDAKKALLEISLLLSTRHKDHWLKDLLLKSDDPHFPEAVEELSVAIKGSEAADFATALAASQKSRIDFLAMASTPGALRAEFEETYAMHFLKRAPDCDRVAAASLEKAIHYNYPWIIQQTRIEQGICRTFNGEYGASYIGLEEAVRGAEAANYVATEVRALTMLGLVSWSEGHSADAWFDIQTGLSLCASHVCTAMTTYSLYANMDNFAEDSNLWHLQTIVAKQALATLGDDPDHLMRAVEHNRLAKAALLANDPALAQYSIQKSAELLDKEPDTPVTENYRVVIEIDLAKLDSQHGNSVGARWHLAEAGKHIRRIEDQYILSDYYQALGHLQLQLHEVVRADESLRWAIAFSETQLRSLGSERDGLAWQRSNASAYKDLVELELLKGEPRIGLSIWEWFLGAPLRSKYLRSDNHFQRLNPVPLHMSGAAAPALPDLSYVIKGFESLHRTTAISVVALSDGAGEWVADDRGVAFVRLSSDARSIALHEHRLLRLCSAPDGDIQQLRQEGRTLYATLVAPISKHLLNARTLLFDGETELLDFPFQALVTDSSRYLIEDYAVAVVPGILFTTNRRRDEHISLHSRTLIVASPLANLSLSGSNFSLPEVLQEASEISAKFQNAQVVTDPGISPNEFDLRFRDAVVFHYAGHSAVTGQRAGLIVPAAVNEQEIVLDSFRVLSLRPEHMSLAVLSACSTERNHEQGLADPDGLTAAFLQIGVPHVVASRWDIDSSTTVKIMDAFYKALLSGASIPQALSSSERLIRASTKTSHPYYWAAFTSFGTSD
jgi:CHAT domain-containing protein/tetratricopeptide (TPR) repeat protein